MSKTKNVVISLITTIILGGIIYYLMLPPINLSSLFFWLYLLILSSIYGLVSFCLSVDRLGRVNSLPKSSYLSVSSMVVAFLLILFVNFCLSPLFHASSYASRITIDESRTFTDDIAPVNFNALPLLDKDSSQKLGDRVMGQMPELVSQFYVSDLYTQINYNDKIVRVTPLEYEGLIKYFSNRNDGVKGYITVDSVTGEATLTKLEEGMKFMPSAFFNEDLNRHLRMHYLTDIFGEAQFEIDNEGNPWWIVPVIKYTGVGLKSEIAAIITLDPQSGKTEKYPVSEVPSWIDHVYSASLIIEQVDDWGKYRTGFWNSIFGQKNVVQTTEGYNYIAMNDDVYLYTGVTSIVSDESNLGFILTNMRTKETNFYAAPGAEEYSAMASAEGQVQQMQYTSTFPLLINLNGKPTYLISLKDNAGLVKMYAFVDVADYQKVTVTDSSKGILEAAKNYLGGFVQTGDELITKEITISTLQTAILDGTTYYYITDIEGKKYRASLKLSPLSMPFVQVGDKLTVIYASEEEVRELIKIK